MRARVTQGSTGAALQEVASDIYQMKRIGAEAVCQCALEIIACRPDDHALCAHLTQQVADEFRHVQMFARLLDSNHLSRPPMAFVRAYAALMRKISAQNDRLLALIVSIEMCTSAEIVAMQQLSAFSELTEFLVLLNDEERHSAVALEVRNSLSTPRSAIEKAEATLAAVSMSLIAVLLWWPARHRHYEKLGLDTLLFVDQVVERASSRLRPLGVAFPQQIVRRAARVLL